MFNGFDDVVPSHLRLKGHGQGHAGRGDSDYVGEACLQQRLTVGNLPSKQYNGWRRGVRE